jgi:hypothetical protein
LPVLVYEHAKPGALHSVPLNKGSEASAYLQFIVDHYSCLPSWTLFLHGHGQTPPPTTGAAKSGPNGTVDALLGAAGSGGASVQWQGSKRHHPTDPARVAALLDVGAIGRGFLPLGHFAAPEARRMHGAAQAFSARAARARPTEHRAAFVPPEEGKSGGCSCEVLQALLPELRLSCGGGGGGGPQGPAVQPRGWAVGAEFWVSASRVSARPLEYWEEALRLSMHGRDLPRFGSPGKVASRAGYCLESLWAPVFGDDPFGFEMPFKTIEELPRVPFARRCEEAKGALSIPACDAN